MSPNIPSRPSCSGSFPSWSPYTSAIELWRAYPKFQVAFNAVSNFYLFCPASLSILKKMHTYSHIWLHRFCCCCSQIMLPGNIFTQIWSGGKCWLDMYRRGAGQTVGEYVTLDKTFNNLHNKRLTQVSRWKPDESPLQNTRWFKYDRDWFVCKQAALRSSCATLRERSHNLHPPSCSR